MEFHRLNPGRRYYLMAVLVLVAGVLFFTWRMHSGMERLLDSMTRVVVPGAQLLQLEEPGHYTVFYEYISKIGNKVYNTGPNLSGLVCELNLSNTTDFVPLKISPDPTEYTSGSRAGVAIFEFDVVQTGPHVLTGYYEEGTGRSTVVLAVGREFRSRLSGVTRLGLLVMVASGVIALVITIVVFIKRHRAKEQRLQDL